MRKFTIFIFSLVALGQLVNSATKNADSKVDRQATIIPGLTSGHLEDQLQGRVLIEELNCVACHQSMADIERSSKLAPRLLKVAERVNPYYLEQFIESPADIKQGTTMPDVLAHLPEDERQKSAKSLTHFLLSLSNSEQFELLPNDAVAAEKGEYLFHTVGCVACHSPRDKLGKELLQQQSTPLGALEKKYHVKSLTEFLVAPHNIRPSGRMPNMRLPRADAERIANYLLREIKVPGHLKYTLLQGRVWEGLDVEVEKKRSGHVQDFKLSNINQLQGNSAIIYEGFLKIATPGEYSFFLEFNGGELWLNDQEVVNLVPSSRRGVKEAQGTTTLETGWNKIKLIYIHAGKEPHLLFEMKGPEFNRKPIPANLLSVSKETIPSYRPYPIDPELVSQGKQEFTQHGCANCHTDIQVSKLNNKPLSELNPTQGCLSDTNGKWPQFSLSPQQQAQIQMSLTDLETKPLEPREIIRKSLVTFNCIACHQRTDLGGVSPERNHLFSGAHKELGNEGRIPPPLTHVGAKLPKDWIKEVLLRGGQQREYMATTMPQYGEANVGHLIDLFEKVDQLEQVTYAKITNLQQHKDAGHELMGTTGFSCIACHDFNGQKATGPGAMELIYSTSRLKKDWFYLFMLNPARFHPNTVMPTAWPNGHVFKKEILGGDAKKQIESLWIYLADRQRAKNPVGLSRKSPELRVTDQTLICRGRGNAGYRGIAVGYPNRISLAFDSVEMNLRLLWKGEFATVNNGSFSARGSNRIEFPQGIPFHRLKSMDADWPYKRKTDYLFPQDHGYQFRGYYLDKQQRPTFMYTYGKIKIEEFYEDRLDQDKQAYFRRTFTFDTSADQPVFYFRAASGSKIIEESENSFAIGKLRISTHGQPQHIIRDGETQELLIPLTLSAGKSTLILDYQW